MTVVFMLWPASGRGRRLLSCKLLCPVPTAFFSSLRRAAISTQHNVNLVSRRHGVTTLPPRLDCHCFRVEHDLRIVAVPGAVGDRDGVWRWCRPTAKSRRPVDNCHAKSYAAHR